MTRRLPLAFLALIAASLLGGCASWISSSSTPVRVNQTVAPQQEATQEDLPRAGDAGRNLSGAQPPARVH